jgi:SAM-dependent methyltransferase
MSDAGGDSCLHAFERPEEHEAIAAMVQRRSTNRDDVIETLLRGLDLSFAREVLDLGCGFGLFSGKVASCVAPDACLTGVDACAANEGPFRRRVERAGRRARFAAMRIESPLPWADRAFDLVLCSYSLYFFPEVLPELARVLAAQGCALVLTHSRRSFHALLVAAGLDPATSGLTSLIERFPAEGARARLAAFFETVERVAYPNTLRFARQDTDDVLAYLRFKLPLLPVDWDADDAVPETMRRSIEHWLVAHDGLIVEKNDAGFRCRGPRG